MNLTEQSAALFTVSLKTFSGIQYFVGGSSSFDMVPNPYNKYYALYIYCTKIGLLHSEVAFIGDDYGDGGNDESVYLSDFNFIKVDNYLDFPKIMREYTEE